MSTYDRVWTVLTGVLVAVGLIASLHDPGVLPSVGLFLTSAMLGAVLTLAIVSLVDPDGPLVALPTIGGAVTGSVVLTLAGWAHVFGSATFGVVMVLVVTSPTVWALCRRLRDRSAGPAEGSRRKVRSVSTDVVPRQVVPAPAPVPIAVDDAAVDLEVPDAMDDADICLAWCSSFVALQRADTPESRLRVVQIRAIYLDELERRNDAAFAAWLASGARAAAHPRSFLRP